MCECCDYIAAGGGEPDDPALIAEFEDRWRRHTRRLVRRSGFVIQAVESDWPPFAYTIGLSGMNHPEVVVFGLDFDRARSLLGLIAEGVRDHGVELRDGDPLHVFGWPLRIFQVPNPADVVVRANVYYERPPDRSVSAVQLVYPDVHGTWPWEPDCHLFPGQQPLPGHLST